MAARFAWYSDTRCASMASVRLRVLRPIEALRRMGVEADFRGAGDDVAGYDAAVFSKSFSTRALAAAHAAAAAGRAVIVDLCDNVLAKPPSLRRPGEHARIRAMLALADRVTFSTPTLAAQLAGCAPGVAGKAVVVPDALDALPPPAAVGCAGRGLARLDGFLAAHPGALRCVWFGKSKLGYAGMEHLAPAARRLEALAARRPVTLTVISNSWPLYALASCTWRVPSFYLPWAMDSFGAALAMHDIAVIPVERNGYTLGKTINRPATALLAGLGVIADSIPAYEELRPFIALDDWEGGLARHAAAAARDDQRIAAGRAFLERRYGLDAVGERWLEVLSGAVKA